MALDSGSLITYSISKTLTPPPHRPSNLKPLRSFPFSDHFSSFQARLVFFMRVFKWHHISFTLKTLQSGCTVTNKGKPALKYTNLKTES